MTATMTILGLYNYDPTIFDKLHIPTGIDKQRLIFHICEECGFLQVLFPNPEYIKESIDAWSMGMLTGWERFWKAVNTNYEPLNNYDRTEDVAEDMTGTATGARTAFNEDTFKDTDRNKNDAKRNMHTRTYGNIGVTTSQQMLEAELDITKKLNVYKHIANDFKEKYCVVIY